ncbi:MAG: LLM class flavin-dependent oxidoreductase [Candidatus Binatia bacterium]
MPINILGMIGVAPPAGGATVHVIGGGIDRDYVCRFSQVHEQAGFDAVLVGYTSSSAEGFQIAQYVAAHTNHLKFLVAHRPGFVMPTLTARTAATFDNLTDGRLWLHIISGGADSEQQRDGDWLGHDDRYARTDEYLEIVRRVWTAEKPFNFEGRFYNVRKAFSEVRAAQKPHVPIYFGGASDAAVRVGAKHADVYALFGEPRAAIRTMMDRILTEATQYDRQPRFNISFRPILAATERAAWEKARNILAQLESAPQRLAVTSEAEFSRRLMQLADAQDVYDERLWMGLVKVSGASGNTTALVGTPEQVAEAIVSYYDLGVRGVLIRGFDPFADTQEFGKELIPRIRALVAERDMKTAIKEETYAVH